MTRRLVLVGGGLAHLHVLRMWSRSPVSGVELVLVAPPDWLYSGMVPGFLRGAYERDALQVDLASLARCAGARHVTGVATGISRSASIVTTPSGTLAFDVCSVDVGSGIGGSGIPGVREHAIALRPMDSAVTIRARLDGLIASLRPFHVVVAGAGAGGLEVALALRQRIIAARADGTVAVVDESRTLLPSEPAAVRRTITTLLTERGIGLVLGSAVTSVTSGAIRLASNTDVPANLIVWTLGSAPPPVLAASDLTTDADGYLAVDRTLAMVGGTGIYGAGDCIALAGGPRLPRSGAYAVRQGPVLLANLRAALGAGRRRHYRPRSRSLVILDTADGRALARWGPLHWHGAAAGWLKRRIDRRFVERFHMTCDEPGAARG